MEEWLDASRQPDRAPMRSGCDAARELTPPATLTHRYTYTYDDAGRLTTVDNRGTPGVPDVLLVYAYDAAGNRVGVTELVGRIATTHTTSYSYDGARAEIDRDHPVRQRGDRQAQSDLSYDAAGELTGSARFAELARAQVVADKLVHLRSRPASSPG